MADYGLTTGLAVKLPWDQMVHQEQQNYVMQQQKQLMAEQKAKLFADDASYNNVANDFDNPRIKAYSLKKISELGSFIKDNPGWETDPGARIVYNQIKRDLKDNPELNRGLLTEANFKVYQDYIHNPKNADIVNSPEFQNISTQWNNYRKYGNQHGQEGLSTGGVQPFIFSAPEDVLDTTKIFKEYGNAMTQTDVSSDGKYWRVGTAKNDLQDAANALLSNPLYKRRIEKDFESNGKDKYKTVEDMVVDGLTPWKKPDQVHKVDNAGDAYKYARLKSLSQSDGTNVLEDAAKLSKELYDKKQGNEVPFKGDAVAYIHGAKSGMLDTQDAIVPSVFGSSGKQQLGVVSATPKEKLRYKGRDISGKDQWVAPYDVKLSRDQMSAKFGLTPEYLNELDSALDYVDNSSAPKPTLYSYRKIIRKEPVVDSKTGETKTDTQGQPVYNYIFEVEKPVGINKWNSDAANAEYKVPVKQRTDEIDLEDSSDDKITIKGF